jgi:TRAP-type C4-dicarboxylate transport system substrate-binding protein
MFMNKASYARLPAKAKAAIDKNSSVGLSKEFGDVLDRIAVEQYETIQKLPGHTIAKLEPGERARWDRLVEPVIDAWIAETPNGAAVWAAYKAELQKSRLTN